MHRLGLLLVSLLVAALVSGQPASDFSQRIYFADAADLTKLTVAFTDVTLDSADAACSSAPQCALKYRLEHRESYREVPVSAVAVDTQNSEMHKLRITLGAAPTDLKGLAFVAFALKTTPRIPAGSKAKAAYFEIAVKPQLKQIPIDETEAFEGPRGLVRVQYASVFPVDVPDEERQRASMSKAVTFTDAADFDRSYSGYVTSFEHTVDANKLVHQLDISGAPRAKKLTLNVGGLETGLQASTSVQTTALPKGRDDATFFLRVGVDANEIKEERKYTLDVRAREAWRFGERWEVGPTLDATLGNKTAKAPNSGALSLDLRYYVPAPPDRWFRSRVLIAPIFRTDRDFANENLGLDAIWELVIPRLDQPLEQRRKAEVARGGPPLARVWGWTVRPNVGVEVGRHLKSSSPEIDDQTFSRVRAALQLGIERGRWKFSITGAHRHLFEEEVLLEQGNLVEISANEKRYTRADLTYDVGIVGISLSHMKGRQPPAWSPTDATSLGLTWKY